MVDVQVQIQESFLDFTDPIGQHLGNIPGLDDNGVLEGHDG